MATATNLSFGGTTLVNITGVGGAYWQLVRRPNKMAFRSISLHDTAYRVLRTIGLAQTDATAGTFVFGCIAQVSNHAAAETLIGVMAAFQQSGAAGSLIYATPTFNGTAATLTNMVLDSFPMGAPVIQAPASGSLWRVHFQIKFVKFGT